MIEIKLDGLKQLQDRLAELEPKLAARELANAVRVGASTVQKEVRKNAPDSPRQHKHGDLRQNIKVRRIRATERNAVAFGVSTGAAFYAKFIEFGRGIVQIKKRRVLSDGRQFFGEEVKAVAPNPFMRKSFDESAGRALENIRARLAAGLERIARRR
jgi:HK97 gp10 family phage protein